MILHRNSFYIIIGILSVCLGLTVGVYAQTDSANEQIDILQDELETHKAQQDQISKKIEESKARIREYTGQAATLSGDIAIIENQVSLAKLDIDQTKIEIESQQLEIKIIQEEINEQEEKMSRQVALLRELIFELSKQDGVELFEILFSADTVNELLSQLEGLQTIGDDLQGALKDAKETRESLGDQKAQQENRFDLLLELEDTLQNKIKNLEYQAGAKQILIAKTQESEAQYRLLMSELREEQQAISNQVLILQAELEGKLSSLDESGTQTRISWPLHGILTALFHDPTYPFRHLFEHSGLDIAVQSGTPVLAAAPGYVAWAKTGNSYGNYIMIIHPGGYATLYAHLSSMNVAQDQYVGRGEIIGYSGSTGLSTGPHLHFEVRLNGIPVNPQSYLSSY